MYGYYIRTLTDSLNDIYRAFLLSLVKHSFMIIVNQGAGLKSIVLSRLIFDYYIFVIFNLTLNLKLRSGGNL